MKRLILTLVAAMLSLSVVGGCGGNEQGWKRNDVEPLSLERKEEGREKYSRLGKGIREDFPYYGQISSLKTDTPSQKYPHTTAVQIQHAKYAFITVDEKGKQKTIVLPDRIAKQLPKNINELAPEEIVQYLPKNIQEYLPKGSEHLTPEVVANLIKQANIKQDKGTPAANKKQPIAPPAKQTTPPAKEEQQTKTPPATTQHQLTQLEQKVVELTNQERRKHGLPELQIDLALSRVARMKSEDMQKNNYFSHTSPTYGSPFDMMRDFGISYRAAAENIAQGQRTAEEVVQAWMNSSGHRANILNKNYTHIGVGHTPNGNYWTQMFITK